MANKDIPDTVSITIPNGYPPNHSKIEVIKAIRSLSYMGLKEAKDLSESPGQHTLQVVMNTVSSSPAIEFENFCRILRNNGCLVGPSINRVIQSLRELGADALRLGEDELANEILQMVLSEKLKRGI